MSKVVDDVSIRVAAPADLPTIAALVKSLAHYYLDDAAAALPEWLAVTLTQEAFLTRLDDPAYLNLVFEQDGVIIGYIAMREPGVLYHLFVSEESQRQGVARQLWEYVRQRSDANVFILRASLYAVPVYKRFGFVESAPVGFKGGISFQPMELKVTR